jgi:adenylosuccinate lyase
MPLQQDVKPDNVHTECANSMVKHDVMAFVTFLSEYLAYILSAKKSSPRLHS